MGEDCVSYQDLKVVVEGIEEACEASKDQSIAFSLSKIFNTVLPCEWGGIGVFRKSSDTAQASIDFVSYVERYAPMEKDLRKWSTFSSELVNNWYNMRHSLFIDNLQQTLIRNRVSLTKGSVQPDNLIFDGISKGEQGLGCFYFLVNVDKAMVPKYQIIMNLLLSSLYDTLIRLSQKNAPNAEYNMQLTEREKQIIFRIRGGLNNKSIARQLNISVNTVKCHIYNIFQKLHATNRVDALVKAEKAGYIT